RRPLTTVLSSVSIRSLLSCRQFCAPSTSTDDQIMTVRTTGIRWTQDGVDRTQSGVYWGEGDPRNTIVDRNNDPTDYRGSMLRSIAMALKQAKKDGLKRVRVLTDFKFKDQDYRKELQKMKKRGFTMRNRRQLPNSELYDEIVKSMDEIEVEFEYRSPWLLNSQGNEVMKLLREDRRKKHPDANVTNFTAKDYTSDWMISPKVSFPLKGRTVPTVYTVGRLELNPYTGFKLGSYASLWAPESIEHLEIRQRPLGSTQRLSILPVTHFRAQLIAIHDSIQEAQVLNIPEIRVITDSLHFMHFFKTGWQKMDGTPCANHRWYLKIKALTETTQVHFQGIQNTEDTEDELLMKVHELANNGLRFPIQNNDTKGHGMSVDELLAGKDAVYSVEGTSTRRARIFKKATGCPLGVLWDRMDGVPLEEDEGKAADSCMDGVEKKTPCAMLHSMMEHADKMCFECVVIRTNNPKLVRSTLASLEIWHRNEWNDSKNREVKEQELWKRIWEIKERIEIIWDLIEEVDEVMDEPYLAKYRKRVRKKKTEIKKGRPKETAKGLSS
ncbi:hypothetical protein PENTCL1PPCAC_5638, partial [Pristionchus entomophagus]